MDSRLRLSPTLLNLISDYEKNREKNVLIYLDEKELKQIISYYENEDDLSRALDLIEQAIKQFSYRSDFLCLKAQIYMKKGLLDAAMEVLAQAELIAPYEMEIQLVKANIYIHQKRYDEAIILIEDLKSYATKSDLEGISITESCFYESIQEYDMMFQCLKQALILNPNSEEALLLMYNSIDQSKNYEESILLHKVIIENHPYNYLAWYNLGHSYASVGEYQLAIEALEYSFIINPEFESGYLDCAGYCCELKKYDLALDIYNEALLIFEPDFDLLMNMAECLYSLGHIDKAKRALFEALEMDSYNDEAFFLLAKCHIRNENWNGAIKVLRKAINIEKNVEEYYHALATAYNEVKQTERAKYYFRKAAEKGFEQAKYWEDFIIFLMKHRKYEEANKVAIKADRYTFSYRLQYLRACTYVGLGKKKRGFDMLEEALEEAFAEHDIIFAMPLEIADDREIKSMIAYFRN